MTVLNIDKPDLQINEVVAVARDNIAVDVSSQAVDRIQKSRALVERWVAEERVIYGITTGFGVHGYLFNRGPEVHSPMTHNYPVD